MADYRLTDDELADSRKGIPISHTTHLFQENPIFHGFKYSKSIMSKPTLVHIIYNSFMMNKMNTYFSIVTKELHEGLKIVENVKKKSFVSVGITTLKTPGMKICIA